MKKHVVVAVLALLLAGAAIPAWATEEGASKNVVVGVEVGQIENDIENVSPITLGVGGALNASLTSVTSDVKLTQMLLSLGYRVSDNLTPYILIGSTGLRFDQDLIGAASIGGFSGSLDILRTEYARNLFTWGIGARGDVYEWDNGIKLGYDVRWLGTRGSDSDDAEVVPGLLSMSVSNKQKADYSSASLSLVVSKDFEIGDRAKENKPFQSVRPYVGYRIARNELNVKNELSAYGISVGTEENVVGVNNSALLGVGTKITENWAADIGGIIGQERGIAAKATFSF